MFRVRQDEDDALLGCSSPEWLCRRYSRLDIHDALMKIMPVNRTTRRGIEPVSRIPIGRCDGEFSRFIPGRSTLRWLHH
jgi:hypothetical protein